MPKAGFTCQLIELIAALNKFNDWQKHRNANAFKENRGNQQKYDGELFAEPKSQCARMSVVFAVRHEFLSDSAVTSA